MIFLTAHTDTELVNAAFSAGALGYVVKSHLTTDLVPAIRDVLGGSLFASPTLGMDEKADIRRSAEVQGEKLPAF